MRTVRRVHLGGYNMADYTELPDTAVGIGGIPSGTTATALRDNPIAIAEGAVGAPRIANGAVADATLGAEKFQSGTTEVGWVLGRTAAASVGAVGTYAFLRAGVAVNEGTTVAGSSLGYSSTANNSGGTPSGTWRAMGDIPSGPEATLFLRIV